MWTALLLVGVLALIGAFFWWRWTSRLRFSGRVEEAWQEVVRALARRRQALDDFHSALRATGYVAEGRRRLWEAIQDLRKAEAEGPRRLAEADERLRIVLRFVYGGLPRERAPQVREAQNRLAEAEDELDIVRQRYNELTLDWNGLLRLFPYRYIARWRGLTAREPYLLRTQEAEFMRRHTPPI